MIGRLIMTALLLSNFSLAMESFNDESPWFISRLVIKRQPFTKQLADEGKQELAVAIEPFYHLQIYDVKSAPLSTSAIKAIKRVKHFFIIYTSSGSQYNMPSKNMVTIDSLRDMLSRTNPEFSVYRRRDMHQIATAIDDRRISPREVYKTWTPYEPKKHDDIFKFSRTLLRMKYGQELHLDLSETDMATMEYFMDQKSARRQQPSG